VSARSGAGSRPVSGGSVRAFVPADEGAIGRIMSDSLAVDRLPGFRESEIPRSLGRMAAEPARTVVALEGEAVVGFCAPFLDDLRVHPDHRGRGHGGRLVAAAAEVERARGDDLTLYVPSHLDGSVAFAERHGFRYHSSQWQFVLAPGTVVPGPSFAAEVVATAIDPRDIEDLDGWVAFLLESFEGHPSPMRWTTEGMRRVHASASFDGTGVLVVAERAGAAPESFVAFARVETYVEDGVLAGEIGLIGVVPAWRRRGLGRELLRWGVAELRGRGVGPIELTVEAANDAATRLYRDAGFEPAVEWPHWVLPRG